jgi:hypothetical protein
LERNVKVWYHSSVGTHDKVDVLPEDMMEYGDERKFCYPYGMDASASAVRVTMIERVDSVRGHSRKERQSTDEESGLQMCGVPAQNPKRGQTGQKKSLVASRVTLGGKRQNSSLDRKSDISVHD